MNIILLQDIFGEPVHWPVNSDRFEDLFEEPALKFVRLHNVDVFYVSHADRNRILDRYKHRYKKLHFHFLSDPGNPLKSDEADNAKTQLSIDQTATTPNQALSIKEYVLTEPVITLNNSFTILERLNPSSENDVSVKKNDKINQHSVSQTRIHTQNNINDRLQCSKDFATTKLCHDKNFRNEPECLPTVCTVCHWIGPLEVYQEHLNQHHPNDLVTCSICTQQIERNKIHEHYLSETHQRVLPTILLHLQLTIIANNRQQKSKFFQIHDAMSIASNDVTMINNTIQRLKDEFRTYKNSLQILVRESDSLESLIEENENCLRGMGAVHAVSGQEIESLKQHLVDPQVMSFDGTFIWRISDVEQKMSDAQFERQRSIYSPEFFSSLVGYKMCSRLFLNGVNNACGTHLSIYFILMQGEYDALLKWPFAFKVSFTLLDQSTSEYNQRHFSDFFWSDTRSNCFRRPRSKMNEAYGIEHFVSLKQFRQNQHRYVQNDTIFIKVEVDFRSVLPEFSLDSGRMLLNDEKHTDTNDDDLMRKFLFTLESIDGVE